MNVLIHISALQKGFLMTLGNILSKKKNKVYYLCRDTNVQKLLLKNLSKKSY